MRKKIHLATSPTFGNLLEQLFCNNKWPEKHPNIMTPEESLNLFTFLFTATVYVMTHSSVVLLKVMSILFHAVILTSSLLPGPDCCLSALWHLSHSGSVSQWRCEGPGTQTGPLDTCLRDRKTKDGVHTSGLKQDSSFTWKALTALTVLSSETQNAPKGFYVWLHVQWYCSIHN